VHVWITLLQCEHVDLIMPPAWGLRGVAEQANSGAHILFIQSGLKVVLYVALHGHEACTEPDLPRCWKALRVNSAEGGEVRARRTSYYHLYMLHTIGNVYIRMLSKCISGGITKASMAVRDQTQHVGLVEEGSCPIDLQQAVKSEAPALRILLVHVGNQ